VKAQVALGVIAALALVACGHVDQGATESPTEGRTDQSSIESPKEGLADFLECMRQIQHDYEPADTPAALAAESDAVVTGTIVALRPGQSYAALWKTSVLEVRVDQVLAGDSAVVADGSVYVEVPTFDRAPCPATVPKAYGVFFLNDRTTEPYSGAILDEGAGRPAGARLTAPFVQGFLIEDADDKLVSVWESFELMPPAWRGLDSVEDVLVKIG
jgi:hypothetical protein